MELVTGLRLNPSEWFENPFCSDMEYAAGHKNICLYQLCTAEQLLFQLYRLEREGTLRYPFVSEPSYTNDLPLVLSEP